MTENSLMSVRTFRLRTAWGLAVLLLALVAVVSCSKRKILIEPVDGLEGVASSSQLLVWAETPITISTYRDTCRVVFLGCEGSGSFGSEDIFEGDEVLWGGNPGTVRALIFDLTTAEKFEVFRNTSGTFRPLLDF